MPYIKRKRSTSSYKKTPYAKRFKSAFKRGRVGYANVLRTSLNKRVNRIESMIETKEGAFSVANVALAHNNVYVWTQNPLASLQGTGDPMVGNPNRIGDKVTVRGIAACFFLEGAVGRSKVFFRVMLLKGPRGASFNRADIFKQITGNKMIDQMNTEKYTVVAQKRFNLEPPNGTGTGIAGLTGTPTGGVNGISGTKIVKFWIPGRKFGKLGNLTYESGTTDPKFCDYRWCVLAYDWYGTPQDTNNVGLINECWSKMYFKDA